MSRPLGSGGYELRFESRLDAARSLAFPCDAAGHVDMDALSEAARLEYLFARAVVGCEFSRPAVRTRAACQDGLSAQLT